MSLTRREKESQVVGESVGREEEEDEEEFWREIIVPPACTSAKNPKVGYCPLAQQRSSQRGPVQLKRRAWATCGV